MVYDGTQGVFNAQEIKSLSRQSCQRDDKKDEEEEEYVSQVGGRDGVLLCLVSRRSAG